MTSRENFLQTLQFNAAVPPLQWEFAYWYDTIQRWYGEGLPKKDPPEELPHLQWVAAEGCPGPDIFFERKYTDRDVKNFFHFDEGLRSVGVDLTPKPAFEEKIIQEDEETLTFLNGEGKTLKVRKDGTSMPAFLEYPVKSKSDFEEMKERFNPDSPERFPREWPELVKEYASRNFPLQLGGGNFCGFFSIIREMMGLEDAIFAFYDDPEFVRSMLLFFTDYYINLYERVLADTDVDYILFWEDMCYKNGPLIGPDLFREFIQPCYKRAIDLFRERGVKHFWVDTDGNPEMLLPLFIDAGITGMYPFEVQSGIDIRQVRKDFPDFIIAGGIDKKALAAGKDAIDNELDKVEEMISKGGYIPYTDHAVPPDVSFENYTYFRKGMQKIMETYAYE